MDVRGSSGRDLTFPALPKRHANFDNWEFEARAAVMAACSPDFDASLMFPHITKDQEHPWIYTVRGAGCEKKKDAFRSINTKIWSALLKAMKNAIAGENDGSASLRWKMFYDQLYKNTKIWIQVPPSARAAALAAAAESVDEEGSDDGGQEG